MRLAGIEKCSFVDYPGHLTATVFTRGCNFNCFYCHNRALIEQSTASSPCRAAADPSDRSDPSDPSGAKRAASSRRMGEAHSAVSEAASIVSEAASTPSTPSIEFLGWLTTRRHKLDAVTITGGEPTLQRNLPWFIREVRARGFRVKLDTNGSRPWVLEALLDEDLLDYVAMDVKAPLDKYKQYAGGTLDEAELVDNVRRSMAILLGGPTAYEFRTTVVPQLTHRDILDIAETIQGAWRYTLQQYRVPKESPQSSVSSLEPSAFNLQTPDSRLRTPPHPKTWPTPILGQLERLVHNVELRGFECGDQEEAAEAVSAA